MAKVNFLNQESHLCQKDTFLNFMVIHIRKPENEGTLFREKLDLLKRQPVLLVK